MATIKDIENRIVLWRDNALANARIENDKAEEYMKAWRLHKSEKWSRKASVATGRARYFLAQADAYDDTIQLIRNNPLTGD